MKLLFVVNSFENGAIPHILLDLAPFLKNFGWEIVFLALEPLPASHLSVSRCRELGFPIHSLNLSSKALFLALRVLRAAIRSFQPDVIHTHLGRADIFTSIVKGVVPQITTFHSVKENYHRFTLWGYKATDHLVSHRTGVSQATIDSLYQDGFLRSSCSVITNPIDPQRLMVNVSRNDLQKRYGWSSVKDFRLVSLVGRLIPVKMHGDFIAAFPLLLGSYPGLCAAIIGQGPLKLPLEQRVKDLGLQDRIKFIGAWDTPADWYNASCALVFPSLGEGLGLVAIEAMMTGCPVAASRIPAVQEYLCDGKNGRLFEVHNPSSLAEALGEILENEKAYRQRLKASHADLIKRFSPQLIAMQYHQLYTQILGLT